MNIASNQKQGNVNLSVSTKHDGVVRTSTKTVFLSLGVVLFADGLNV